MESETNRASCLCATDTGSCFLTFSPYHQCPSCRSQFKATGAAQSEEETSGTSIDPLFPPQILPTQGHTVDGGLAVSGRKQASQAPRMLDEGKNDGKLSWKT